ncbi:hypothetical protein Btru_075736 [Bulinus truncatus]|nr:hypothetical protein Btru_075736 [Bulinus truncatus]
MPLYALGQLGHGLGTQEFTIFKYMTMSSRKPSGAKRRAEQKEKLAKVETLLLKVPKLETYRFKPLSTVTATTTPDISSKAVISPESEHVDAENTLSVEKGSCLATQAEAVVFSSESQPKSTHDQERTCH